MASGKRMKRKIRITRRKNEVIELKIEVRKKKHSDKKEAILFSKGICFTVWYT
jgi:hypothetical protein